MPFRHRRWWWTIGVALAVGMISFIYVERHSFLRFCMDCKTPQVHSVILASLRSAKFATGEGDFRRGFGTLDAIDGIPFPLCVDVLVPPPTMVWTTAFPDGSVMWASENDEPIIRKDDPPRFIAASANPVGGHRYFVFLDPQSPDGISTRWLEDDRVSWHFHRLMSDLTQAEQAVEHEFRVRNALEFPLRLPRDLVPRHGSGVQ